MYRKKSKIRKSLIFSIIVFFIVSGTYIMFYARESIAETFILLTESRDNGIVYRDLSVNVDSAITDYGQYDKGEYHQVYEYLATVTKVDNSGLKMTLGDDGYYQMISDKEETKFNIMQITDIHITGAEETYEEDLQALQAVYSLIKNKKPDFIILTGDVIFGVKNYNNTNGLRALNVICYLMDRCGINWTWTFGNHDHVFLDNFTDNTVKKLLSQSKLLKMYDNNREIHGYTNGVFKFLNKDNTLAQAVILLDSGGEAVNELGKTEYDYIRDDQVEWYSEQINCLKNKYGKNVKSIVYTHIPLYEYNIDFNDDDILTGVKREPVGVGKAHSKIFESMVENESTQAIFCGHDHLNDFVARYKGIYLGYGKSIDYIAYDGIGDKTEQRGAANVKIYGNGACDIEQILLAG